jgi:uncharacterized membrane protein YebE (DUF533 family)
MRSFLYGLLAIVFISSFATQAEARRGGGYSTAQELLFVAPTQLGTNEKPLALCHLVSTNSVIFVNFWRTMEGYAIAENGCQTDSYFEFEVDRLKLAQAAGAIDADIPEVPKLSLAEISGGFWGFGAIALLLGFAALKAAKSAARKKQRLGLMTSGTSGAKAILDAMCHAAKSDGRVDPSEIATIKSVANKMTGETFTEETVRQMIDLANASLNDAGYSALIKGCSKEEQLDMMRGVLLVVASDGHFAGKEKEFVGGLAKAMKMAPEIITSLLAEITAPTTE